MSESAARDRWWQVLQGHPGRAILLVAIVQTLIAGSLLWHRVALLSNGTEVAVRTRFVDPRDLFRGHYAALQMEIAVIDRAGVEIDAGVVAGQPVYAELAPSGDGPFWQVTALHKRPEDARGPVLKGRAVYIDGTGISLDFGIDRYFAPKSRAQELEALRREDRLGIILSLSPTGEAAIKGLVIDDRKLYDPALF